MSILAISATSPAISAAPEQQHQQARPAAQATKVETVSISKQAQQLASDGDTADQEVRESAAEKAGETLKGKK
jgi:hypothetical protein